MLGAALPFLLLLLAACDSQATAPPPAPTAAPADDCLVVVWEKRGRDSQAFDRAHDRARGGAISCATGAGASHFDAALAAIRAAAAEGDRTAILSQVGIPLLYIDAAGERRELSEPAAIDAAFDEVFSPEVLTLLSRVELAEMEVVEGQGAFFELGAVWLVVDEDTGRPRIVTVNAQALGEAAEAARRKAARGDSAPAPLSDE